MRKFIKRNIIDIDDDNTRKAVKEFGKAIQDVIVSKLVKANEKEKRP